MASIDAQLDSRAIGLKLYRDDIGEHLRAYELVTFDRGREAVETLLRRAQLTKDAVTFDPFDLGDFWADVYINEDTWSQSVALTKPAFDYLKDKMRPRRDHD